MIDNDYILRKAAIDIALDWCPYDDGSVVKTGDLRDMLDELEAIPASDVVSRDAFNRLLAENDIMRTQLAQIKKKPGDNMEDVRFAVYTVKESLNNYGADVTKLWQTAIAQKTALDAAYMRGKNDAYKQEAAKDDPYKPLWPNWED